MRKIRILFVVLQLDAGGSERVVFELARSLDPTEFDVYVAAFKSGVLEPAFRKTCKEVFFIEKRLSFDPLAMLKLSKIIQRNRIDVVNAHHYLPCFYSFLGASIFHRRKLIYTEHSVPEVVDVARSKHGSLFEVMLHRIDVVIGVSREITTEFKKSYSRHTDKFTTVLNGVDVEKFRGNGCREDVRSQFGFSPQHYVVGMVANFRKVKNHACLIRAVARLKKDCPQLRVLLVGTGFPGDTENSEGDIRNLTKEYGLAERVVFSGYQKDIPAMLSAFDVFCLPSFSEGLPVSVLEAMSSGLVVIGSRVSGISEVIEHGKTGYLFSSNDDEALSGLIAMIIKNKHMNNLIRLNAEEKIKIYYSKDIWMKKMLNLFKCD